MLIEYNYVRLIGAPEKGRARRIRRSGAVVKGRVLLKLYARHVKINTSMSEDVGYGVLGNR